jgi:hypothetical protein
VKRSGLACLLLLSFVSTEARAAGGAHIVDDSEVETPGVCHYEAWVTRFVPGDGYANFSPACTLSKMPTLEVGAIFQHYWDEATNAPLLGPSVKLNLRPASSGLGVAIEFNGGVNLRTGNFAVGQVIVPVTIPLLDDKVRVNLNAGWSYVRGADYPDALFYGAQVQADVGFDITLMLEAFGRAQGIAAALGASGAQMGLRYTPRNGPIDFDFLAGGFFGSMSSRFFTVGVTFRH